MFCWPPVNNPLCFSAPTLVFRIARHPFYSGCQRSSSPAFVGKELKQARTATTVNKQLNFTVKNKPHTTNYMYTAYLKHILWLKVCERTVLTVLNPFLSNVYQRREGCRRAEDGKLSNFHVFRTTATFSAVKGVTQDWLQNSQYSSFTNI